MPEEQPDAMKGEIVLVLKPVRDPLSDEGIDRDPEYRLRLALKDLLRRYGFKCVKIRVQDKEVKDDG